MRVRLGLGILAVAAAVVVAGCGGGGKKAPTGAASIVPDDVAAFVAVNSNLASPQWDQAQVLLDRFPGKESLLSQLRSSLEKQGIDWETDLKPALGNEIDFAWLDFQNGGANVVGVTKPKDVAKFNAALEKGSNPTVHEDVEGWTVFAEAQAQLDQFNRMRENAGSLDDDSVFSQAMGELPADAIATAFVSGAAIKTSLDRALSTSGVPSKLTEGQIGKLDSISAAVTPESDGVRLDSALNGTDFGGGGYHADLPSSLPSGALAYASFNNLSGRLRKLLESYRELNPSFAQQQSQVEAALGVRLDEVFDLLSGEGALALYRSPSGSAEILFTVRVDDEDKARRLIRRAAALAELGGTATTTQVQIGSVQATEFTVSGTRIYSAAFDGKLAIANSRTPIEGMQGGGSKLADDPAYKASVSGASVPSETNGFVYFNLRDGLGYLFDYLEGQGTTISQVVRGNVAPLRGLLLYASKSGDRFQLNGFLGIK